MKHENFCRLRDKRLGKAEQAISLLGNLSSSNYDYSNGEAEELVALLHMFVDEVGESFGIENSSTAPADQQVTTNNNMLIPTLDYSNAAWAYDKLIVGKVDAAKLLLKKALVTYKEIPPQPTK